MSLSGIPRALARAMSLPALLARSCCAAAALDCLDSSPTQTTARSGLLDTRAVPLGITPGSKVVALEGAEGAARGMEGVLTAGTARVAVRAQSVPMAAESVMVQEVDGVS